MNQLKLLETIINNPENLRFSGSLADYDVMQDEIVYESLAATATPPSVPSGTTLATTSVAFTLTSPKNLYLRTGNNRRVFVAMTYACVSSESSGNAVYAVCPPHLAYGNSADFQMTDASVVRCDSRLNVNRYTDATMDRVYLQELQEKDWKRLPALWVFGLNEASEKLMWAATGTHTTPQTIKVVLRGIMIDCKSQLAEDRLKRAIDTEGIGPNFWDSQLKFPKISNENIIVAMIQGKQFYFPRNVYPDFKLHSIGAKFTPTTGTLAAATTSYVGGSQLLTNTSLSTYVAHKSARYIISSAAQTINSSQTNWDSYKQSSQLSLWLNGVDNGLQGVRRLCTLPDVGGCLEVSEYMKAVSAGTIYEFHADFTRTRAAIAPYAYCANGNLALYVANESSEAHDVHSSYTFVRTEGILIDFPTSEVSAQNFDRFVARQQGAFFAAATDNQIAMWAQR